MSSTSTSRQRVSRAMLFFMITAAASRAAPPILYREPAYESPVSGEPDELLLIPGYGFDANDRVVYGALVGNDQPPRRPAEVPEVPTPSMGVAEIVSLADLPYSLTIRLPKVMRPGQEYAFWVVTPQGEWSQPVRINDARPLWVTPAFVYESATLASMPRYLKVVGRNLEPAPHHSTQVRLTGPQSLVLDADPAGDRATDLDRYMALVRLPERLEPGAYRIALTRDGSHWVSLSGQILEVRPDPPPSPEFEVGAAAYGGCKPGGRDATACVVRAIAAARAAGGGTVTFASGIWSLSRSSMASVNGIEVPPGVSLQGAGKLATTISLLDDGNATAAFTLLGHNRVQGITFHDQRVYTTGRELDTALKLGAGPSGALPGAELGPDVQDVVITQNVFDRPNIAISDSGSAIKHLFITDNEFGAFKSALELAGNRFAVSRPFNLADSVIVHNVFKPGSYLDVKGRQGSLASEIGASRRVDFSENLADGAAADRLYAPDDAHGWRAAFFWHMNNNHEMLLVSQNVARCTGDKAGDGEAIAYDNNANTFGLPRAETALRAGSNDVTVEGPLAVRQNSRDVPAASYYVGHWVQIAEGPGVGQVRKIVSYTQDRGTGAITLTVSPAWDVRPAPGRSRVSIGREFWQVYTIANTVDQRAPPCQKSNRTAHKGGVIAVWAQTADSAVAGNRQYDTDGILYQQYYNAEEADCENCRSETFYIDFLQIRDNVIAGEYDWRDDCSSSGIFGSMAAAETPHSPPPTASYGVTIAYNTVDHADGWQGGAISLLPTWFEGPTPHRWPLVASTLIDHNSLLGLHGPAASPCRGGPSHARTAISLGKSALTRATVLYENACPEAERPLEVNDSAVVKVCPAEARESCECASP